MCGHHECKAFLEQASSSQHSSFFPSSSSPILMNGEGIYQRQRLPHSGPMAAQACNGQDMEMGEEINGGGGDATAACFRSSGMKRSFDDDEETSFKRPRLFGESNYEAVGWFIHVRYVFVSVLIVCWFLKIRNRSHRSVLTLSLVIDKPAVKQWQRLLFLDAI